MPLSRFLPSMIVAGLAGACLIAGLTSSVLRAATPAAQTQDQDAPARAQAVKEVYQWNRTHAGHVFDSPDLTVVGNPNGKITLVEFFDYHCAHCRNIVSELDHLLQANRDIRVVLADFPFLSPKSWEAAGVAVALRSQFKADKFWQFYRTMMTSRGARDEAEARAVAQGLGADMTRLSNDLNNAEIKATLDQEKTLAHALDIHVTPSFVIGDAVFTGEMKFDRLNALVGNMRRCGKTDCG